MEFKYKRFKEEFNYLEVLAPREEFDYINFTIAGEEYEGLEKVFEHWPELRQNDYLRLLIELETGKVINWPKELGHFDFYDFKLCDSGIYALMKTPQPSEDDLSYEGYVPGCIGEGGYGDYLEFEINDEGYIDDWDFDNEDYKEFLERQDDWEDEDDD